MENKRDIPLIGFSIGDINGVGPELIINTLSDPRILKMCTPIIYGSGKLFAQYRRLVENKNFNYHQADHIGNIHFGKVNVINVWSEEIILTPGQSTADGGKYAFLSLKAAATDWVNDKIDALVTAPINKHNIQSEEFKFSGHTGYLTQLCGKSESLMLMSSDLLKVALVTEHLPLQEVSKNINKELIIKKTELLINALRKDYGITKPKIAVLGLNPHAGDNGVIGKEEQELIAPTIDILQQKNHLVYGPFPSDGFFAASSYTKYDGILAMYHDQGLIPFKQLAFSDGVNYTAGIGKIRTSPDHGTAYDIVGKGLVDISSFRSAIYLALDIIKERNKTNQD